MITQFSLPFGWSSNKWLLVLSNMFAGIFLIILSHTKVFPLENVNFLFFSFVGLLFTLYRPGWTFLLLVGMLPYEIINIAPVHYSLILRPYQWLLVLIVISLLVRLVLKRFPVEKFIPNMWDMSVVLLGISAFLSAGMSDHTATALKLSVILFSFILLYFIVRIFVRSIDDIQMILPFILSSFLIIALYAIFQNILFLNGRESFELMAGRPNATFPEADWLGGYLAIIIVLLGALLASRKNFTPVFQYIFSTLLFFGYTALLITVSRSAWLATFFGIVTILLLFVWQSGIRQIFVERNRAILLEIFSLKLFLFIPLLMAFFAVYLFGLSPFDLLDRSKSTATGEQKITVACDQDSTLPVELKKIESIDQLSAWHCRHIMLEEIDTEVANGKFISTVYRDDPNINIRAGIYVKVVQILKDKPLFGIGFGNISSLLGTDERGTGLNASNIFLEVWLGAGVIGCLAFLFFWIGLGMKWLYEAVRGNSSIAIVLISLWVTLTIFNLFNSGLFLGFFFVCMAFFLITPPHLHE